MNEDNPEIPKFIKDLINSGEKIDEIKIDTEGNWFFNGEQFINKRIVRFFNKHIDITKDGEYVVHYDKFTHPIVVEDAPIFVTGVKIAEKGTDEKVYLTLTNEESEVLDIKTLHYKNECLYCYVKNGKLLAKFKRSPSFEMLYRLEETDDVYYIHMGGQKIILKEKI